MQPNLYAPVRIVLADDHEMFREGFKTLIKKQPDIELVGEAEDGSELLKITRALLPDVVLTDIAMPVMNGIEATRQIIAEYPHIFIIALTMSDDDHLIIDMLESGAKGYLLKNAHKTEIFEAIKTVYKGDTYYCRHTSEKLTHLIAKSRYNPYKEIPQESFSPRETDIIRLICEEYSNKEMADYLSLSVRTIEGYRERIQEKMRVRNGAGIVVYAIRHGIFKV
jgi:DNA-binding NarL/FixJ family response regulator